MLRRCLIVASLCVAVCSSLLADDLPKPVRSLELQEGDSIVFLGDSITHQCLYTQYVEDYLYTRFPKMRLKIHNAGVGGAKAWDALQRFDKDVAAYQPKYVTILLGMNDGKYQPYDQEIFDTYQNDMTELLGKIEGIGATPVLMTPTMFDARARRLQLKRQNKEEDRAGIQMYNSTLAYYGAWLRDVATERGFGFVDMWSPLNNITLNERKKAADFTMIADAVHPGPAGQVVMAAAIINDLDFPREVSLIEINQDEQGAWNANVRGGEIADLKANADGCSFTFTADALPWVLPEQAREGAEIVNIGHRYGRETLRVAGLKPGQYTLSIDGTVVAELGAEELAHRVPLESNEKTPQYQQALAVAELNKKRNEGPVKALRGLWSRFQMYAHFKRNSEENPNDQNVKENLAKVSEELATLDEDVAKQNAAARELEDEIFRINQPQARKYEIVRKK